MLIQVGDEFICVAGDNPHWIVGNVYSIRKSVNVGRYPYVILDEFSGSGVFSYEELMGNKVDGGHNAFYPRKLLTDKDIFHLKMTGRLP